MINRRRRLISGLLSGALGLTAIAQEPAAPAGDQFKAPANVAAAPAEAATIVRIKFRLVNFDIFLYEKNNKNNPAIVKLKVSGIALL